MPLLVTRAFRNKKDKAFLSNTHIYYMLMAMMDMTGYLKDLVYYQISSKDADKIIIINYDSRNKLLL